MRNEDKLHFIRHLTDDIAETPHICIVERCVHLIEHAKRCRIQFEYREDQCHRRQRFFATRQQMNRTVTFTRRTSHHGNSRRQEIVAGELQVGMTAAKQLREQAFETLVDVIVSLAEARARFPVDLANRTFERCQGVIEIRKLRIQVLLAFRLLLELVDRSQVDRSQPVDSGPDRRQLVLPGQDRRRFVHFLKQYVVVE